MKMSKEKRALIAGMIGCSLYVIGDFLFAATGKTQSTESIGLMVKVAYLDMATWRMVVSIICGVLGTALYYIGFHQMWKLLKRHLTQPKRQKWVKLFQIAYLTGTVCWGYVHAMFTNMALIFKFTFEKYGDMQAAAEIANKVFYCNAAPLLASYILCDVLLSVVMIVMIWKKMLSEKHSTSDTRILLQPHRFYGNRGKSLHASAVAAESDRSRHGICRAPVGAGAWTDFIAGDGEMRRM